MPAQHKTMPTKATHSPFASEIGERIARLRKTRGMTQVDLARQLRLKQPQISEYERGLVQVRSQTVVAIARILRVRTDDILGLGKQVSRGRKPSHGLIERMRRIADLPKKDRQALLRTIDGFLASQEIADDGHRRDGRSRKADLETSTTDRSRRQGA